MTGKKNRHIKLWLAVVISVLFWTIGTGFNRQLAADSEETFKGLKLFSEVIELVQKNYVDEVESEELIEKAIQGMVRSLDPHSALLPPEAFEDLSIDTKGKFTGIGIHITMRDGFVTVISPIEGTPAYKAGIKAMDKIIKVDDQPISELREAVNMMRGPKGTKVKVTIVRESESEPLEFNLVRDVIPIESVRASLIKPGYGYIRITNFNSGTTEDVKKALQELESESPALKGLVLDFRDNGGGLLDQAIRVSDLFLEEGLILTIRGRLKRNTKEFSAHPNSVARNYPIVALINGGSASASEIVVGALQDHKRALVLGTTSFGKGSVQTVETLRDGYGLKLTIARYFTPKGRSIQAKGIEPDIVVTKRLADKEDPASNDDGRLKEKDLKNHLEALPPGSKKNDKNSEKKQDKRKPPTQKELELQHGPLTLEKLQSDYQVMRALEILISYDVFKNLKG
jgi:carboxyl-terminal processing protease